MHYMDSAFFCLGCKQKHVSLYPALWDTKSKNDLVWHYFFMILLCAVYIFLMDINSGFENICIH